MVFFENETEFTFDFNPEELALTVSEYILKKEKCPYPYEINVYLTDGDKIRSLNREFRDIDRVTDVLSFPNVEFESPADFKFLEKEEMKAGSFDPETGCLSLGDMVICGEQMIKQAEEYGHGIKREFAFLVAHSTLHLIGYDHMEASEAEIMEGKQKQYLEELGIGR